MNIKKILTGSFSLILIVASVTSCENDLPTNFPFTAYEFSDLDMDGGNWQPILFASGSSIVN
jgi:hypothetical protein